jgi:hypothetical protein
MTVATRLSPQERLEVREACERLALDYSFHADRLEWEPWSQLFADDGEMHLFGQVFKGPAAIRGAVAANSSPNSLSVHAISNHRIDVVSEDEARGTVYVIVYAGERKAAGQPVTVDKITPMIVGTYHDVYRRDGGGWKFAQRRFEPLVATTPA